MGSIEVHFRKFELMPRRITEVRRDGRTFTLVLALAVTVNSSGLFAAGQKGHSPVTAVTTLSAEDLLASPAGANWTSYNGDYTGRRYSSLGEINTTNVVQLRASWV